MATERLRMAGGFRRPTATAWLISVLALVGATACVASRPAWLNQSPAPLTTPLPNSSLVPATAPPGPLTSPLPISSMAVATSLGPPAWATPGTRISYYGAAASVVQSGYTYIEDPRGEWEDPKTHKRYHRTDQGSDPQDMPGAAGQAYTQTDVLAVDGSSVVLSTTMYGINLSDGKLGLNPMGGFSGEGAAVDGAWINPALLADLVNTGYGDQMILRGPYALGGNTYDGISFVSQGQGAYHDSTFDAASGVMLAMNAAVSGQGSPVHGPLDDPQGNVQLSHSRLVGVRQLALPGLGAVVPSWVAAGTSLAYSGTCTVVNPVDPSAVFPYGMQSTVSFDSVGATWASFTSRSVIDFVQYQQPTEAKGTTGATGTYWYDPAALATLTTGQVLDQDPITGAQVSVESADGGTVTLRSDFNGGTVRLGYDTASGVLVTMETSSEITGITIALRLTGG
jgi:hypothetical protein